MVLNKLAMFVTAFGLFVSPAAADLILTYTLTADGCTGGCGTAPFGTITLDQVNSTTVLVTETLAGTNHFVSTGAGDSLEFNLSGVTGTTTLTNITSPFTQQSGTQTASTFGSFGFGVDCSTCQHNNLNTLSFDVNNVNGIGITNFVTNSKGNFFAADIAGNGNTGNVAAPGAGVLTGTPEPATFGLLSLGLGGIAFAHRRSRKRD